jgi:lipooligosaccharide transport system ATP-binding protein
MGKPVAQYIIEAEGLTKKFGDLAAVDGINFHVTAGECFGILGPNGAGKTTTVRMAYGFSPKTAGTLKVFGLDIEKDWQSIKSRIGVCQQENSLDPDLSVEQNLLVFARYFDIPPGRAREKAQQLLQFISLDNRRGAKVTELSGGMMRRMILARSLINDPELLILDEPTTGLDPQARHQLWQRLEELKAGGLTILLTTHYMDEASRLCDRLVIMHQGKILVEGKPADLIREHVGHNVIEVDDPAENLRAFVKSQSLECEDLGHRLIIYGQGRDDLFHEIGDRFCTGGCILRMATLEDVFLKLTGRELKE